MSVIHLLLTLSLIVALVFLILFLVAVKKGQYDDLDSPPVRLITPPKKTKAKN
jgi:cbb3-type cytochrome oxidase maturation protein